jgi:Tol biopolymer transport system component
MSPEQATGGADARSDLYGLGCVLYEMLAGVPPFGGPTAQAVLARHAVDPVPPLRTLRPAVPVAVERALMKVMAKVPADRFASAAEFASALVTESVGGSDETVPVHTRSRKALRRALPSRRIVAAATALSILAIVAVLALRWRPTGAPAPALHRQLTFTGRTGSPAISPDGGWVAYVTADQAGTRDPIPRYSLQAQPLPSGPPVTLAESVFASPPVWSPDGSTLMFSGRSRASWFVGIQTVARAGGRVTQVAPNAWVYGYRRDGQALVRATFDTLVIQDILSGAEISRINLDGRMGDITAVDWSGDGEWIAFCAFHGVDAIGLVKPDGSGFRVLTDGCWPRWRGNRLYFTRGSPGGADLFRVDLDLRTGSPHGKPRLIFSGVGNELSLTRDARTLVYSRAPSNVHVWTIELDGATGAFRPQARQLTSGTRAHWAPDLSGDGRSVLFANEEGLFVMPFAGDSAPRWVATPRPDVVGPRWSPDGAKIAFALGDSTGGSLFMADQATGRVAKVDTIRPNIPPDFGWSADGKRLAFSRMGRRDLFVLDLASGRATDLQYDERYRVFTPVLSPDGREVVATDYVGLNAADGIGRTTVGTGEWSHADTEFPNIRFLRWARDGWIYAGVTAGGPARKASVHRMPASGGELEPYFEAPVPCDIREMAMSADARRFVCTVELYEPDVWMVQNFDPDLR